MVWLLMVPGAVGPSTHQLILSHDGRTPFVTVEGEASTAVLETANGQLLRRLAVVDLVDLRLLHQLEVGSFPEEMAVFPEQAE
jgi:hypothetical protein